MPLLRDSGVSVVTQPGFLWQRGERYLQTLSGHEIDHLYRHASIAAAGINVVVSSDAPYGPLNPWQVIHAATERRTREGKIIGADEGIAAETALVSYLRQPHSLTAPPRSITVGSDADICVLQQPWRGLFDRVADTRVLMTVGNGELIYHADAGAQRH